MMRFTINPDYTKITYLRTNMYLHAVRIRIKTIEKKNVGVY